MANEDQYINPIIQAMVHTANLQAGAKELAEKTRQAKAEENFRQSQLAQQESQFQKSHDLAQQQADIVRKQRDAEIASMHLENLIKLNSAHGTGLDIGKILGQTATGGEGPQASYAPQAQIPTTLNPNAGTGKVDVPGIGTIDPSGLTSPGQMLEIAQKAARATAAGTAEGAAPTHEAQQAADFKRAMFMKQYEYDKSIDTEKLRAENNIRVAQIHAAASRAALTTQQDPELIANAYKGILDGQTSYSALPKDVKIGVNQLAAARGTSLPTNQKQYSDRLDTVSGIEDLITQYKDLAINYSRDSEGSNILYRLPLLNGTKIPYTDLKSKADALKATGGSLASFFDKQNRKSDAEILRQFDGLFDPKSTMEQNLAKINSHVKLVNTHLKGLFSGMAPDDLSMILGNRGLTQLNPTEAAAPSSGPKIYKFDAQGNPQ